MMAASLPRFLYLAQPRNHQLTTRDIETPITMVPSNLHEQLLILSDVVSGLIAYQLTPDALLQILLNFTKEIKTQLPPEAVKAVQAAEAKAVLRALAYRRDD